MVLIYLCQIVAIALIGIAAGLVLSVAISAGAVYGLSSYLPVSAGLKLYPQALLLATAFGMITTLIFTILPLGRAREIPATALFRQRATDADRRIRPAFYLYSAVHVGAVFPRIRHSAADRRLGRAGACSGVLRFP